MTVSKWRRVHEKGVPDSAFFSLDASHAERRALLDRYGVQYVLVTEPNTLRDAGALGLVLVWSGDEAALYRVEGGP